jgi:hypothetical protein
MYKKKLVAHIIVETPLNIAFRRAPTRNKYSRRLHLAQWLISTT